MLRIGVAILSALFAVGPQKDSSPQRIIAASNVRLRSEPRTNADILAALSLGTVLNQLEVSADGSWYRLLAPEGKSGWVFASLTQPFSERESTSIYRRIIETRFKADSLSFPEASELFQFVDRITPQIQGAGRAEFDLFRLRALARSLSPIHRFEPTDAAQQDWLKKHEQDVDYSEPAAEWLVKADLYWQLEIRHRGNPIAEQIAWEAANAGIPGECEGYIPCHLTVVLLTDAHYLDLYPTGGHAAEALDRIDFLLQEATKPNNPYYTDSRDAAEMRESIAKLARILEKTSSGKKTNMLARLKQMGI